MKKKIIILFIAFLVILIPCSIANNDNTINEQKNTFEINDFIKNSKQYIGSDFLEENDINQLLDDAIKGQVNNKNITAKIWGIFGKEFKSTLSTLVSILAIIVIHSDSLENDGVSKLIYYVQYILIVTIIMTNFSDVVKIVKEATVNMVGFINLLIPLLTSLMVFTGSITTSSMIEPVILFLVNLIGNLIQSVLIPFVLVIAALSIVSKISDKVQINKLSNFMKSGVVWALGIFLTLFVSVISLEGTLSSSVDGISAKTTKAVVSSAIPIVGKILGDAVDTVLGCGIILKNAVGIVGVVIIIGICITPILKLALITVSYKILAGICEPIADEKIMKLLDQIGDIFKIFLAILASVSVLMIIGVTLVVKISNSAMMYR